MGLLDTFMEFKRGILFVRLSGILNGDTCSTFNKELNELISINGIKYVLINLNGLEYVDRYGIDTIISNYNSILRNNGKLLLCGITRLFEYDSSITKNLYQISDERSAFNLIHI